MTDAITEKITEHILSLVLYALAEADIYKMENIVKILDEAIIKIIAEYEKTHSSKEIWKKCDQLYQMILKNINDRDTNNKILTLKDIE